MISHRHKFIFIHIPKTGGTSIREALKPYTDITIHGHFNLPGIIQRSKSSLTADSVESYLKFGFTRNPWSRFVSCYNYFKHYGNRVYMDTHNGNIVNRYKSFREFTLDFPNIHQELGDRHFLPQNTWTHELDYIGKVENINEEFNKICKRCRISNVAIPHRNKSQKDLDNYRDYYDNTTRNIIYDHYIEDITSLGYSY